MRRSNLSEPSVSTLPEASADVTCAASRRMIWAWSLMLASLVLFALRDAVALGERLPWGTAGSPVAARAAKLSGWLWMGEVHRFWSWPAYRAGMIWEWLPAILFSLGLALWVMTHRGTRSPRLRSLRPLPMAAALGLVASLIALGCFGGMPHVQDSIAQEFQARVFASGRVADSLPAVPAAFPNEFLVAHGGRWFAQYAPGQALMQAVGVRAGLPWLVNPLLAALSAGLIYAASRRIYDKSTAALALLFFCLSPFVWFMSGERMNHPATLFWICLTLWAVAPGLSRRRPSPGVQLPVWRWLLAGVAIGCAISTRPLCGVAAGLPLLIGALWPARFERLPQRAVALCAVGGAMGLVPLLLFNAWTTGSTFLTGYELQWGSSGWGFGKSQWGQPHTPLAGIVNVLKNWDAAAKYLWEWPIPGLIPLVGVLAGKRARVNRGDLTLVAILALVSLAYLPYFYQDLCLGPRFLYAAMPAFCILSARGLLRLGVALARWREIPPSQGVGVALRAAALCSAAGLAVNLPVLTEYYQSSFWGTDRSIVDAVHEAGIRRAVVFIRDRNRAREAELRERGVTWRTAHAAVDVLEPAWLDKQLRAHDVGQLSNKALEERLAKVAAHPPAELRRRTPPWEEYRGRSSNYLLGFLANTPDLKNQRIIYALHRGEDDREVLQAYPVREAWLWDWDNAKLRFRLIRRFPPSGTRQARAGGSSQRR